MDPSKVQQVPPAESAHHDQLIHTLADNTTQTSQNLKATSQQMANLTAQVSALEGDLPVCDLEPFRGDLDKCQGFLLQCCLVFQQHLHSFPSLFQGELCHRTAERRSTSPGTRHELHNYTFDCPTYVSEAFRQTPDNPLRYTLQRPIHGGVLDTGGRGRLERVSPHGSLPPGVEPTNQRHSGAPRTPRGPAQPHLHHDGAGRPHDWG